MKRLRLPDFGVLEVLWLQAVGVSAFAWYTWPVVDADGYFAVSERVFQGLVPYRDFPFEYPPLALVPLLAPRLTALGGSMSLNDYQAVLLGMNMMFSLLTGLCVACTSQKIGRARTGAVAVYATLAILISPLLAWRYDAFPALLTAAGLLAFVRGRPACAGVWLGLGTVAKIYPIFLVALWGAHYLAAGERRQCVYLVCAAAATAALVMLPFRVLAPEQWLSFLTYHRERGFEMGSTLAGALWLPRSLGLTQATIVYNYGAAHITSPIATALLPWTVPLVVLAVGGVVLLYFERFSEEHEAMGTARLGTVASGTLAVLATFIDVNKVFSPQYIIWLIPFVPFLPRRDIGLAGLITGLTVWIYPFSWHGYLAGQLVPTLAVNCRNLLVLGLVVSLCLRPKDRAGPEAAGDRSVEEESGTREMRHPRDQQFGKDIVLRNRLR